MQLIPEININIKNLIYDCGTNVAVIDVELARQRLDALNKHNGPRIGDFVWFPNEDRPRRFTCDLSDGSMQTTTNLSGPHFRRSLSRL